MEEKVIERLVETHLLSELEEAKKALVEGRGVKFSLPGDTPGEKVSYLVAAIWIVEKIRLDKCDFKLAYKAYQQVIKDK